MNDAPLGVGHSSEQAYDFYDSLTATLGIDGFETEWEDQDGGKPSRIVLALNSNQVKNVDNLNPTENPDIRYSRETKSTLMLDERGDLIPTVNKTYTEEDFSNNAAILKKKDWKYNIDYEDEIKLILDGDYLKLYYWGNYMHTFCRLNDETYAELKTFLKTEKYDRSKVTWPRHADGTCDYDDNKSTNTVVSTNKITTTAVTNVAQNKIMTVNENLKLRSAEATTSTVLNVMAVGTKVKVLELGKAETIDGINSNWVKVEIISGKDRDGNTINSGTTGWCYGGYLE